MKHILQILTYWQKQTLYFYMQYVLFIFITFNTMALQQVNFGTSVCMTDTHKTTQLSITLLTCHDQSTQSGNSLSSFIHGRLARLYTIIKHDNHKSARIRIVNLVRVPFCNFEILRKSKLVKLAGWPPRKLLVLGPWSWGFPLDTHPYPSIIRPLSRNHVILTYYAHPIQRVLTY